MKFWTNLAVASCLSLVAVPAAQATTVADQGSYVSHTVDCLGLLLTNPEAHSAECGGPFELPGPAKTIAPGLTKGCTTIAMLDQDGFEQLGGELKVAVNPCCYHYGMVTQVPGGWLVAPGNRVDVAEACGR